MNKTDIIREVKNMTESKLEELLKDDEFSEQYHSMDYDISSYSGEIMEAIQNYIPFDIDEYDEEELEEWAECNEDEYHVAIAKYLIEDAESLDDTETECQVTIALLYTYARNLLDEL